MRVRFVSDEELEYEFKKFKRTDDDEKLREIATLWAYQNAEKRFSLAEDQISELVLSFYKKFPICLEAFFKRKYDDFPAFLSVVVKNIFLSIYNIDKKPILEEYLKLWDRDGIDRAYQENVYSEKNIRDLNHYFRILTPMEKIIICIRFNLELEQKENEFLNWYLGSKGIELNYFKDKIIERAIEKKAERQILLRRINSCNRKLYSGSFKYKNIQVRKKHLIQRVSHTYKMYSLTEISELLDINYHKVCYYYSKSMRVLKSMFKDEIETRKAA